MQGFTSFETACWLYEHHRYPEAAAALVDVLGVFAGLGIAQDHFDAALARTQFIWLDHEMAGEPLSL